MTDRDRETMPPAATEPPEAEEAPPARRRDLLPLAEEAGIRVLDRRAGTRPARRFLVFNPTD